MIGLFNVTQVHTVNMMREKCLHSPSKLVLMHCIITFVTCLDSAAANYYNIEESALLALKSSITNDPTHTIATNWSTATSFCDWFGVTCDAHRRRVTALNLPYMGLQGSIPPDIGNLSFIVTLNVSGNSFSGSLPIEMGRWQRLRVLNVRNNSFSGDIASWSDAVCNQNSSLEWMAISVNQFEGKIPPSLFRCKQLKALSLSYNNFVGSIPPEIGNLTLLKQVYLGINKLQGEIPEEVGYLSNLEILSLSDNNLTGPLPPSMFNISTLTQAVLSNNSLYGHLPTFICDRLPLLQSFYASSNLLFGSIPKEISNCTSLSYLEMMRNFLTGMIPQEMGNLGNIIELDMSINDLQGPIPLQLFNISTMEYFGLVGNRLTGSLPSTIGFILPNIKELHLANNNFSGTIPDSIANASQLLVLELSTNSFYGYIPDTLGDLEVLQWLNLGSNNLEGESLPSGELSFLTSLTKSQSLTALILEANPIEGLIPTTIGNLTNSLQMFVASSCKLKGNIPRQIGELSMLTTLMLDNNELRGSIPTTVGEMQSLQYLGLRGNRIQSSIPNELCNMRNLGDLHLANNNLSGPLPKCMGSLTSLRNLNLELNKFDSEIPTTLWGLQDILVLNLSSNTFRGNLPTEIGNLKVATMIDLSRNRFSGNIPSSLGDLQQLINLSLAQNTFKGPIPQSFGKMVALEFLDLSHNNLSGQIPTSMQDLLYLKSLNLSFNTLQGEIPQGGPFVNFTAQSYKGNYELCGPARLQVRPCQNATSIHKSSPRLLKYLVPTLSSFVLILISFMTMVLCWRKRGKHAQSPGNLLPLGAPQRISYHELVKATNGFNKSNLIGAGSVGSVYKGELQSGAIIAIKVFNLEIQGALKSFDVECEVMRSIRHRNLVKIISSCSNIDFMALVLEYMPNGSLEKLLYSGCCCLDILQRLNIMIDIASSLAYLHHDYSSPIVHCDLKPSNILLDVDMVAHLSDFGIAKFLGEGELLKHTMTFATVGYMAPEYGTRGEISPEGDVYSFGITMMETFTRKRPTDKMFTEEMGLKHWVRNFLPDAIMDIVDENLFKGDGFLDDKRSDCISSIMRLASDCCADSPQDRLDMKVVVSTLEKIKKEFLANVE